MKLTRIFILLFVIFYHPAAAQQGVSIKASTDKNKILIGEPLKLTIEIISPDKIKLSFPAIDSIPHFEFSQPPQLDSIFEGGQRAIKTIYTLTSFDSGRWVIPAFALSSKIKSEPLPVDVVFSEFNPDQDYHDIKDIIEVKPKDEKKNWLWYAMAAMVVALGLIYYLTRKKKQPAAAPPPPPINAFEDAMEQLSKLQKQSLEGKEFHTRLVDIFKLYVLRKKNVLSLQKTTDDLVMQLRTIMLDKEQYAVMQQALRLSDFVKFAKYIPSAEDNSSAFNSIKKTIQSIEQNN
jgi:hypothetical protein